RKLVAPRLIALIVTLPLLTLVADVMGIAGGWAVSTFLYDLPSTMFINSVRDGITTDDIIGGIIKPLVFAFLMGTIACHKGLKTEGGTVGVGRSTTTAVVTATIKLVLGLLKPDSRKILVDGEDITNYSEVEMMRVRKKIGMIFQEGALFDSLSVYENVAFKLHEQGVPEDQVENEVRRMLRFVNLEQAIDKMPAELSGGMRRRVGIARALVGDPKIVMFDEPTAGLDPPTARTICELAMKLRDLEDVSSIFVTHEMNNLDYLCSEYAVVNEAGE